MTRINVVPVEELSAVHSAGEYKEILRPISKVKNALEKCAYNKELFYKLYKSMPVDYTLGRGHETFFFDKLQYIVNRYNKLCDDRRKRGLNCNQIPDADLLAGLPKFVLNDYTPTAEAIQLNKERIAIRMREYRQKKLRGIRLMKLIDISGTCSIDTLAQMKLANSGTKHISLHSIFDGFENIASLVDADDAVDEWVIRNWPAMSEFTKVSIYQGQIDFTILDWLSWTIYRGNQHFLRLYDLVEST